MKREQQAVFGTQTKDKNYYKATTNVQHLLFDILHNIYFPFHQLPSSFPSVPPSIYPSFSPSLVPSLTPSLTSSLSHSLPCSLSPSLPPSVPPLLPPSLSLAPSLTFSLSHSLRPSLTPSLPPSPQNEDLHMKVEQLQQEVQSAGGPPSSPSRTHFLARPGSPTAEDQVNRCSIIYNTYVYLCSAPFGNLRNLEIVLCNFGITKVHANLEIAQ